MMGSIILEITSHIKMLVNKRFHMKRSYPIVRGQTALYK